MTSSDISEQKRNLLIVASSLFIGGAETVMSCLARTIDRRRFNVTVCYLKHRGQVGDELFRDGIDIIGIPKRNPSDAGYWSFIKLLKLIRAKRIQLLHTHTYHSLVDSCLCKLLMPRLRVIHTFHFGNYPHMSPRVMWAERIFSRFADQLIAVGEVQRRQIQAVYGLSDRKIRTVWNGVAIRSSAGDPEFRRKVGAEHCVLVGTIATLIEQKGLSDLLDVAKAIRDSGRKAIFVIVGEGVLREELEAKRRTLGLEETVVLTGWVTNAADVALPIFDIFFQPSLWEAMSMVILEAMVAKKAIVATQVGENGKIIEDGVDGLLVRPRESAEMTAALIRLIDDPALRVRLGEAARLKVEQKFTVEHMTKAYEAIYSDLMR